MLADLSRKTSPSKDKRPKWLRDEKAWLAGQDLYPRQWDFHDAIFKYGCDEVGFGGSPGPGKTHVLTRVIGKYALLYPGCSIRLGRFNRVDLDSSTWPLMMDWAIRMRDLYGLQFQEVVGRQQLILMNGADGSKGSIIQKTECKDEGKIQGSNDDVIALDEGPLIRRNVIRQLMERLRGSPRNPAHPKTGKPMWPLLFLWAGNPSPGWAKLGFADRDKARELASIDDGVFKPGKVVYQGADKTDLTKRIFIKSNWRDNPRNPDDYEDRMLRADPSEYTKMRLRGDWGAMPGQVYGAAFSRERCVHQFEPHEITKRPFEESLDKGSYDWGIQHKTAILVGFVGITEMRGSIKKRLFIYKEFVGAETSIAQHIDWMREYPNAQWFADQSIFNPQGFAGKVSGICIVNDFLDAGLNMTRANVGGDKFDTERGIELTRRLMKSDQIIIHPDCEQLLDAIECFSYEPHPDNPDHHVRGKFLEEGEDECDALRYFAINVYDELREFGDEPGQSDGIEVPRTRARAHNGMQDWEEILHNEYEESVRREKAKLRGVPGKNKQDSKNKNRPGGRRKCLRF